MDDESSLKRRRGARRRSRALPWPGVARRVGELHPLALCACAASSRPPEHPVASIAAAAPLFPPSWYFFRAGMLKYVRRAAWVVLTPLPACGSDDSLARANDAAAQSFEESSAARDADSEAVRARAPEAASGESDAADSGVVDSTASESGDGEAEAGEGSAPSCAPSMATGCPYLQPTRGAACTGTLSCTYGNAGYNCQSGMWQLSCCSQTSCPYDNPGNGSSCGGAKGLRCTYGDQLCVCGGANWVCC